jgi:hypothetical protein
MTNAYDGKHACPPARRYMVSARMDARDHCFLRPLEQLRQRFGLVRLSRADAHGERYPVAPPAEVRRSGQPCQRLRMSRQHLRRALVRDDQKLIVAPASQLLGRPQSLRQHATTFSIIASQAPGPVGLAQIVRLIDGDPQHAEDQAAVREVFKFRLQPFFEFRLTRLHALVVACLTVRQRIQALRGMKDDCRADVPAQPVAQHQDSRHRRHVVTQLMPHVNQASAARLRA